ncbi:Lrp/AsnC family transcriptional regulator [Sinorhizobium sp. Sb3]|uniref:Lrp/AsnC family transcriptional regulator n=1 Tax=Sinorhizobium sp. Sb3 TaxID=1358417 RepID=UPI0018D253C5|nr:Lrp/AsnC family transcriptional regulator [Sinorhizobium sp. Sb3]
MVKLDALDVRILETLQNNGKLSNVDLAKIVGLSPSPCLARVKALEGQGLISRYVALLDPEVLGRLMSVFIQVRLERQAVEQLGVFENAVAGFPEVMECYLMTGEADYMLRVIVPNLGALQQFIERLSRIEGVANIRSSFALKQVKYNTAYPVRDITKWNSK